MILLVRFDGELHLVDDEVPQTLNYATVQQALQDSLGVTGVFVLDVTEYEEIAAFTQTALPPPDSSPDVE